MICWASEKWVFGKIWVFEIEIFSDYFYKVLEPPPLFKIIFMMAKGFLCISMWEMDTQFLAFLKIILNSRPEFKCIPDLSLLLCSKNHKKWKLHLPRQSFTISWLWSGFLLDLLCHKLNCSNTFLDIKRRLIMLLYMQVC